MNERLERLVELGRLVREDAPDEEVVGLWANALLAYRDACLTSLSLRGRLTQAYDSGRIAALAIVRCHDFRVRATNHQEITMAAATHLSDAELAKVVQEFAGVRTVRVEVEYGWQDVATVERVEQATGLAGEILERGALLIRNARPHLKQRIEVPS